MTDRPSYILFITDQQRYDHLGCNGHPVLQTPNIDQMAKEGVNFDRFYVASPICMPNRSSLMTCRMPSSHGVRSLGIPLAHDNVTFVELLRAAGYDTALIGKSHLQNVTNWPVKLDAVETRDGYINPPEDLALAKRTDLDNETYQYERQPFYLQDDPKVPLPFYGFDHYDAVLRHGFNTGGNHELYQKKHAPELAKLRSRDVQFDHDYTCPQAIRTKIPEEYYSTTYIADRAVEYLQARKGNPKPFFLMVSFPDPHHPFTPPGKYWDMYDPAEITLPISFYQSNHDQIPPIKYLWEEFSSGAENKRWTFPFITDEHQAREIVAKTFGQITMIDDAIGEIMATLESTGLAENTIVIFMSDHGDHMGEHGMFLKGPVHSQGVLRTPLIWVEPDEQAGQIDGLSSTIDIGNTILDRVNLAPANGMHGRSLIPMIRDQSDAVREVVFVEQATQFTNYLGIDEIKFIHSIITDEWRLTVWQSESWGELYHISEDPEEMRNLWDDPEFAVVKGQLMLQLIHEFQNHAENSPHPTSVS